MAPGAPEEEGEGVADADVLKERPETIALAMLGATVVVLVNELTEPEPLP